MLTRSYLGLNFQTLADQVGIRKASLYHHFASKEALGVALVDEARLGSIAGSPHWPPSHRRGSCWPTSGCCAIRWARATGCARLAPRQANGTAWNHRCIRRCGHCTAAISTG
ncbi:MAG: TetR/AcrR family transcriptional regulator [Burkholderiaceae bacterium]